MANGEHNNVGLGVTETPEPWRAKIAAMTHVNNHLEDGENERAERSGEGERPQHAQPEQNRSSRAERCHESHGWSPCMTKPARNVVGGYGVY